MYRIFNTERNQYYSRKWSNPTFTKLGQIFQTKELAQKCINRIISYQGKYEDYSAILIIEEFK